MAGFNVSPGINNVLTSFLVNTAAGGDIPIVAAVAGKVVRVYRVLIIPTAAATLTWKDGTTVVSGPLAVAINGIYNLEFTGEPWYFSSVGATINLNSTAVQISGNVWFTQQ
jgi:hypothetical protein